MKAWNEMSDAERFAELDDKVMQFKTLSLPGQSPMMHMGTSYLIDKLWDQVKALTEQLASAQ